MRLAVLPRDDAARVITNATARGAWAVNATNLGLAIPVLLEFLITRNLAWAIPVPLAILVVMLALAIVAGIQPKVWLVATFLGVGALGAFAYQLALISASPVVADGALFLLNRPAVSLVLVAVAATTWVSGLLWTFVGFLVSAAVSVAVALVTSMPVRTGWGPLLVLLIYVLAYMVLASIQASARRRVPNFEQLENETRLGSVEESLRSRVTAAVHDTLLNDLSIVMNAPDQLDSRVTDRLRQDLATLRGADWLRESAEVVIDDQDSALRNQLMLIMSDLQWRGLTVQITGSGTGIYRMEPPVATALVEAVRACLENVLRHSGATVAEVDLAYSDEEVTVLVTDQGVGFDAETIPRDRLGIKHSIIDRIEAVGGSVRVWSSVGSGTSIVIRVPVLEVVKHHEESKHNDS